jgi:hypothetical protein
MHCSRVPQHKWHWKCLWQAVFLSSEKTYILIINKKCKLWIVKSSSGLN